MPFWWKWRFWPQWPYPDLWPHYCLCLSSGQGTGLSDQVWSKSNVGKYVKKTCCQKKERTRICCRHRRRTLPGWPQVDPRLTFDPLTKMEGLKLMLMYESYGHAMYHGRVKAFLAKLTFRPSDPKWPQIDIWPHKRGRGSQADARVWVLWPSYVTWTSYSIYSEKRPLDPSDPRLTFDPHNRVRRSQADAHVWVLWSYYVTWTN